MVKIRHMANTFRKVYKKTGNSGSAADYQLVGNIGVNGVELDTMKGATSSVDGEIGLVPKPTKGQQDYLLSGGGVWLPQNSILGSSDISYLGDGTVKGAISRLDAKGLKWVAPVTEELTIPSKGIVQTKITNENLVNHQIISVAFIGSRTPSYTGNITLLGFSRQGETDPNVYLFFYNYYNTSLSNTFQVMIWYADFKLIQEDLEAQE